MHNKLFNKIVSLVSSFALLFNSLSLPLYAYAQEEVVQESQTEESAVIPEETFVAPPEPTPDEAPEPVPTPEPPLAPGPAPEIWTANDNGGYTTLGNVVVGTTYSAPQNSKVSVTFKTLPQDFGTLTIKEIKLSSEEVEELGALSDTAYEITSTMEDGTFEYDLTLPLPPQAPSDLEVKIAETKESLDTAQTVPGETQQTTGTITISGLTHLTVFLAVGRIEEDLAVTPFDESGSNLLINEFVYNDGSDDEWIELYNRGENDVDLSGWKLRDGNNTDSDDIGLSGTILAGGIRVFEHSAFWLNNTPSDGSGDTIELYNGETLVDRVTYQREADETVIDGAQDVGNVDEGQSIGRTEDADDTWAVFDPPTKGYNNFGPKSFITVGEGYPYTSIQTAINEAEGTTVYVLPGTYEEKITIDKELTLLGDPGDDDPGPGGDAPEVTNCGQVLVIESSNVIVSGFIFDGDGCGKRVVRVFSDDGEVSGVTINDNDISGGERGINLTNETSDNEILRNIIHNNNRGISVGSSQGNTISDNEIYDNTRGVVFRDDLGGGDVSNNEISNNYIYENDRGIDGDDSIFFSLLTISGNTIEDNDSYGIYFDQILESVLDILDNIITGNGSGGIYLSGDGGTIQSSTVTVEDNDVSLNSGNGIYGDVIIDSTFEVINNTVNDNSEKGIYLCAEGYCQNSTVTVSENQVSGNGSTGIYFKEIKDGSIVTISDNSVEENSEGEEDTTGIYIYYIYNSTVDILDNDILENFGVGLYIDTIESGEIEEGEDETLVNISGNEIADNTDRGVYMNNVSINEASEVNIGPNNTISNNEGTGIYLDFDASGVSIFENTILSNGGEDTGIYIAEDGNEVHFNRIFGNGVGLGVTGEDPVFVDATNNWWGCNAGPENEDCDSINMGIGSIDFDPWLILSISASPESIFVGGETSNIAGSLTINSDDEDTSGDGNIPDGTLIFFETTLGSIGSTSVYKTTTDGVAEATLTSEDEGGTAEVSATLDNQTVDTEVDIEVEVAAVVSNEDSTTPSTNSAVITWTTDHATSSRVVYDTVSHNPPGDEPNYGYAFSTGTTDTSPKVTSHSVIITGLSAGTRYYFRTVSEGSPTAVGEEGSFQTLSNAGGGGGGGGGGAAATTAVAGAATFFAPIRTFLTTGGAVEEVSAEEVLGEEAEEVSSSPLPEVEGAEAPDRSWLWWFLLLFPLGLGYYYYQKKTR